MTIHWCGTGLSAIPGLRRLLEAGHDVAVWNRTPEKAAEAVGDLTTNIHKFSIARLSELLSPADVVVSMLPGDWHVELAELAINNGAHFVSSSYISPEMRAPPSDMSTFTGKVTSSVRPLIVTLPVAEKLAPFSPPRRGLSLSSSNWAVG